jgi:cation transport regulator ChaC
VQRRLVWYFAYGSNLDPDTFLGRRRMRPAEARPGCLHGYRLVFDLAVGRGERAVANLSAEAGARVHGVAYAISRGQAWWLDRTEGVPRSYRRVGVRLRADDGAELDGFTYVSERRTPGRKPSARYMGLLVRGARHHGLPAEYVDWLRAVELAHDERGAQLELDLDRQA